MEYLSNLFHDLITSPILLVVLGILGRVWQQQLRMKREVRLKEEEAKSKLVDALEKARDERKKELEDAIHHLRTKMQVYENELGMYKAKDIGNERERSLLLEKVEMMKAQLDLRDLENSELRQREIELLRRVSELEDQVAELKGRVVAP